MVKNPISESAKARLVITTDTLSPNYISSSLEIEPSQVWLRGDVVHPKATNVHKENGWVISATSDGDELFVERTVDRLIKLLPKEKLVAFCRKNQGSIDVELSLIIHLSQSGSVPSVALNPNQIRFLADCHGSFDIDIYKGSA